MSNSLPAFPLQFLDARSAPASLSSTHWILVLKGTRSPSELPIFSRSQNTANTIVDDQGRWGLLEWPFYPQELDNSSPWLPFIPLYRSARHITRSTIHRNSIVEVPRRDYEWKESLLFTLIEQLREEIREYSKTVMDQAKDMMEVMRADGQGFNAREIVWPKEALDRATYLWRQIFGGVPSINCCKRAVACLRRALLELEGFCIWGRVMRLPAHERESLAATLRTEKGIAYRGVFLNGSKREWLDEGSAIRSAYTQMRNWGIPVYALLLKLDWAIQPLLSLELSVRPFIPSTNIEEKEAHQLPFHCYPPKVPCIDFERTSRGLCSHPEAGERGEIARLGDVHVRRSRTQDQQRIARVGGFDSMYKKAVGPDNRPHPEIQSRIGRDNDPPPFMSFWQDSYVFGVHPPDLLAPPAGKGTFLPRPSMIWGIKISSVRKIGMLETLTAIWKLLVLRPCLFREGALTAEQAYLSAQGWRDILNRQASDTELPTMWMNGKVELWGSQMLPSVTQNVQTLTAEATLKKMDCAFRCSPSGKFGKEHDPEQHLQHLILFRLAELHILHDIASYHPDLQRHISGRWCPPPFDAQDALNDTPNAFPGIHIEISESEREAMEAILSIVRWNGAEGIRAWEMDDGSSYRDWLAAFRNLLSRSPNAWTHNPILDDIMRYAPSLNILTCDLQSPDAPVEKVTRLVMGTHMLLVMRTGRLPWLWFNKPRLDDLHCDHTWFDNL